MGVATAVNSDTVRAYIGASARSAMAAGLNKDMVKLGDDALRTLTSAMPLIEGLNISSIGYSPKGQDNAPHHGGVPKVTGNGPRQV